MNKNKLLPMAILVVSFLSAFGLSVVKAEDVIRGTTNNETLNGYRSFELGEAILLFMPDKNMESVGWDYRIDAPVIWLTDGYTAEDSRYKEEAFRKGLIRINVEGVKSTILRKTKEELAWRIRYSTSNTPKLGVESIELSIDGGIGDKDADVCFGHLYNNCAFSPEKSMSAVGIHSTKICENNHSLTAGKIIGFELTHPDKRKTFARLFYSSGSGGDSASFELDFSKKEKDLCKDNSNETESVKVESTKETISKKSKVSKKPKTAKEICNEVSSLAKSIMSARQHGVSMSKAMELSGNNKLAESFVIDAYSKSGFSTEEYQDKTIREFADEAYLSCIKMLPRE
jgi:hypothetical protein